MSRRKGSGVEGSMAGRAACRATCQSICASNKRKASGAPEQPDSCGKVGSCNCSTAEGLLASRNSCKLQAATFQQRYLVRAHVLPRHPPRGALVDDQAQRIHVALLAAASGDKLLGRNVVWRACHRRRRQEGPSEVLRKVNDSSLCHLVLSHT